MSVKLYPVQKLDDVCSDYRVKINGEEVALDTARVSAMPFNRRWPGHQRQIEQSELINFLSFATDEVVEIEVFTAKPFEKCEIRPKSLGIVPEITAGGSIKFTLEKPAYFTVEPFGRNHALHIFADPIKEYEKDENTLYFGAGIHDAGMITLKSNQTLFIDEGAVVFGCVEAYNAENIKIIGRGILDNSRNKEKILFEINAENNYADVGNAERIHTVQLEFCTNVEIEGITIRDSLVYNIRPMVCKNLDISNVKIIGCWRFNSDGIDMHNCEDVHISNCFIRTFDDSICVKGFDFYDKVNDGHKHSFKNVLVENCTIWNDWGKCLEIGAETRAVEISNIKFRCCDIIHVTATPMDCMNVDYADIHDVIYEDISIEFDDVIPTPMVQLSDADEYVNPDENFVPNIIRGEIVFHEEYSAGGAERGKMHDFVFRNIYIWGRQDLSMHLEGYDAEHKCSNILIENIYKNGKKVEDIEYKSINEYCENIIIR